MALLQLLCTASGNQAKLDAYNEFKSRQKEGGKLVVQQAVAIHPLLPLLRAHARSAVIFIKCRKVSARTTLPNFINISAETVLYSRFGGHNGRRS